MAAELVRIYIELLEEGTKCWRPVMAVKVSDDTYRITDIVPEGEVWMFRPGEVVRCRTRDIADQTELVAYKSVRS